MSRLCGRAMTQNVAEFVQNLEMCTPKLKKSKIFIIPTFFLHISYSFYMTFCVFLGHFLAQNCQ